MGLGMHEPTYRNWIKSGPPPSLGIGAGPRKGDPIASLSRDWERGLGHAWASLWEEDRIGSYSSCSISSSSRFVCDSCVEEEEEEDEEVEEEEEDVEEEEVPVEEEEEEEGGGCGARATPNATAVRTVQRGSSAVVLLPPSSSSSSSSSTSFSSSTPPHSSPPPPSQVFCGGHVKEYLA